MVSKLAASRVRSTPSRHRASWGAVALVAFSLCGLGEASAEPTAAEKETARGFMDLGDAKAEAKDWRAALSAYQSAHALVAVPTTGLEVAKMQAQLGMLVEARDMALSVARMAPQPREPAVFGRARAEATKLADALADRVPSVRVTMLGVAPSTVVRLEIDGVMLSAEATRLPIKVNPGKHTITARVDGYDSDRWDGDIAERTNAEVTLHLTAKAAPSASVAPPTPPPSSASAAAPAPIAPLLPPAAKPTWPYVALGVGGVGVVVGSIAGGLSASQTSTLKAQCDHGHCPTSSKDDIARANAFANVSNVGFAVGLLGVGVGVYGLFFAAPRGPTSGLRVEPLIGDRAVGARGSF